MLLIHLLFTIQFESAILTFERGLLPKIIYKGDFP